MKYLFALLLPFTLAVVGCNDPYGTAAKLAQDVAVSVDQASKSVDQLRLQGTVSVSEEKNILSYLNSLNTLDGQYVSCIQVSHGSSIPGGLTKCAQTFETGMGNPNVLVALHVENPDSQAEVLAAANGIVTLTTLTITALGGK